MAATLNDVKLIGNLTEDPELLTGNNGVEYCRFTIAVNKTYKGNETVSFFDCTSFNGTASALAEYKVKGDPLLVIGELQQDRWEDKQTGKTRSRVIILANNVQFLPRGGQNNGSANPQRSNPRRSNNQGNQQTRRAPRQQQPVVDDTDFNDEFDDIPF